MMRLQIAAVFALAIWMGVPLWAAEHPPTEGKSCASCHAEVSEHSVLHYPVEQNLCESCHAVPAEGGAADLTAPIDKLCVTCHPAENYSAEFVHGPVAAGACIACHDPHGSEFPKLAFDAGAELCYTCHVDVQTKVTSASTQHQALAVGCTYCHSPHASAQAFQLKMPLTDLCGSCHPAVLDTAAKSPVNHAPVTDARACMNCHDPHASGHGALLRADGVETCLNCHNQELQAGDATVANLGKLLEENPNHHGPIREQNCSGCHIPHGSEVFRLLRNEYPSKFYAPFEEKNFALCFGCHEAGLVKFEHSETITGFRDGNKNLHFIHVNQPAKGRTCRACHETHASKNPFHMSDGVPFGRWTMPINYEKTPTGGGCTPGCHQMRSYDRNID